MAAREQLLKQKYAKNYYSIRQVAWICYFSSEQFQSPERNCMTTTRICLTFETTEPLRSTEAAEFLDVSEPWLNQRFDC